MPTMEVSGMGCDGCEDIVESAVGAVGSVNDVDADYESGEVEYEGDPDRDAVREAVEFAGYEVVDEESTES